MTTSSWLSAPLPWPPPNMPGTTARAIVLRRAALIDRAVGLGHLLADVLAPLAALDDDVARGRARAARAEHRHLDVLSGCGARAAERGAAHADGVDLVDEDDAVAAPLAREPLGLGAHPLHGDDVHADERLREARAGHGHERRVEAGGDGLGEHRLAGAWRPDEEQAALGLAARLLELVAGLPQLDDLAHLFLDVGLAAHVVDLDAPAGVAGLVRLHLADGHEHHRHDEDRADEEVDHEDEEQLRAIGGRHAVPEASRTCRTGRCAQTMLSVKLAGSPRSTSRKNGMTPKSEQVEEREAPDEAPERDAPAQRGVLGEERLVGAEQARPRDEAVGEDVERAARGRERAPGGEERVQLRHADAVAVGQPDGRDRAQRDDVRDAVERAPLEREPDAGAARDEAAAVHGVPGGAATTAPAAFVRCVGGRLLGRCGWLLHRLLHREGRRAQRDPEIASGYVALNCSAVLSTSLPSSDVNAGLRAVRSVGAPRFGRLAPRGGRFSTYPGRLSTIGLARARHKLVPSRPSGQPRCARRATTMVALRPRALLCCTFAPRTCMPAVARACVAVRFRSLRGGIAVVAAIAPSRAPRQRRSYARLRRVIDVPNLIDIQVASFRRFMEEGLREVIDDISPIEDYTGTLAVEFGEYAFDPPARLHPGVPGEGSHVLGTALGDRPLHQQVHRRDPRAAGLHGRLPAHDRVGHLHHQRHRARRRDAARALARRLHPGAQGRCQAALHGQPDAVARLVARARDRQEGPRHGPHRSQAQAADHDTPARAPARGPDDRLRHGHDVQRGDRRSLPRSEDQGREPLHRVHAREGHHDARRRGADRGLQEAAPRRAADARQRARAPALALLRSQALRPHEGRPLQAQPAPARLGRHAGRRPADPDGRARAHHARHPDARAQARLAARHARRPARLARTTPTTRATCSAIRSRTSSTSTSTSATAGCATSASSSRRPSASASTAWSASCASA